MVNTRADAFIPTHPSSHPPTSHTFIHYLSRHKPARRRSFACATFLASNRSLFIMCPLCPRAKEFQLLSALFVRGNRSLCRKISLSPSRTRAHALAFSPSPTRAVFSRVTRKHSHSRAQTHISHSCIWTYETRIGRASSLNPISSSKCTSNPRSCTCVRSASVCLHVCSYMCHVY